MIRPPAAFLFASGLCRKKHRGVRRSTRQRKSFTLIELLMVVTITGILVVGMGSYIYQSVEMWRQVSFRSDIANMLRTGIIRMTRDLRQIARSKQGITVALPNEIDYTVGGSIQRYRFDVSNTSNRRVFHEIDAASDGTFESSRELLGGLTSFNFTYYNQSEAVTTDPLAVYTIEIHAGINDTISGNIMNMQYRVFPRN